MDSGFLQRVDGQAASSAGARHTHRHLAGHHGDGGGLDGPDAGHGLVIGPDHGTPGRNTPTHQELVKGGPHSAGTLSETLFVFAGKKDGDTPASLVKRRDIGECLAGGGVVRGVGRPRVWHRGSLLVLVALFGCSLLSFGQFRLLAVHQQRLMVKGMLMKKKGEEGISRYRELAMELERVCSHVS